MYTVPARFLTTMAHLIATLTVLYDVVRAHATVNMASVQSRSHPLALSTGPSGAQAALGERDSHTSFRLLRLACGFPTPTRAGHFQEGPCKPRCFAND